MTDAEITAIVGWTNQLAMEGFRKVADAARAQGLREAAAWQPIETAKPQVTDAEREGM